MSQEVIDQGRHRRRGSWRKRKSSAAKSLLANFVAPCLRPSRQLSATARWNEQSQSHQQAPPAPKLQRTSVLARPLQLSESSPSSAALSRRCRSASPRESRPHAFLLFSQVSKHSCEAGSLRRRARGGQTQDNTPRRASANLSLLPGADCIGSAQTGSGKTVAFAIPILQALSRDPYGLFALILTPTRCVFCGIHFAAIADIFRHSESWHSRFQSSSASLERRLTSTRLSSSAGWT